MRFKHESMQPDLERAIRPKQRFFSKPPYLRFERKASEKRLYREIFDFLSVLTYFQTDHAD